jgi:hypothetical protein
MRKKCHRLTVMLDASSGTGYVAPIQVMVHCTCLEFCCIGEITLEQAGFLLVKAFGEPAVIRDRMNALLEYKLVELCTAETAPYIFSAHDLSGIGIPIAIKEAT